MISSHCMQHTLVESHRAEAAHQFFILIQTRLWKFYPSAGRGAALPRDPCRPDFGAEWGITFVYGRGWTSCVRTSHGCRRSAASNWFGRWGRNMARSDAIQCRRGIRKWAGDDHVLPPFTPLHRPSKPLSPAQNTVPRVFSYKSRVPEAPSCPTGVC